MLVTENRLDEWVRSNAEVAQGTIVELVWRLVSASSPRPLERRFALGDSIGQHGEDGSLTVEFPYLPFIPVGKSIWEIGTNLNARDKATRDYRERVASVPEEVRRESTFIFVTPMSGRRDWNDTWKEGAQSDWVQERVQRSEWKGVQVIDGTKLVDWLHQFPSVELWLAGNMGHKEEQMELPRQRWELSRSYGEPPPLTPKLFLGNRDEACEKIKAVFDETLVQLKLVTHYPEQTVDFVAAYIATLGDEGRVDAEGRCIIISGPEAWSTVAALKDRHILIADSALDLSGVTGTKLIQMARRAGHSVIFGGPAGGIPEPSSAELRAPRSHHIQEALLEAGYGEERARSLAQRSGGNLGALLRCLQNLSVMPEWAQSNEASELAIAVALGAWKEGNLADQDVIGSVSGNDFGEWIRRVRNAALRPGTPLIQYNGNWKFVSRYEGWYALGPKLFEEHVRRIGQAAVEVLSEIDPQFDLPADERFAASIRGKVLRHSELLRNGISEAIALIGSQPAALASVVLNNAEDIAALTVRKILANPDWRLWASLHDQLPLLAEASPNEFLSAVESVLAIEPCPFVDVFHQEGDGITGGNYISGLLWALETLAWDSKYLSRTLICLAELAKRDPGGKWANRPSNSLQTILLPWFPQTCASIPKRVAAVEAVIKEIPEIGWKLLLGLMPTNHSISSGSRKPAWREIIPEDWPRGVTHEEYVEQSDKYIELAVEVAKSNRFMLAELIDRMENLPENVNDRLLAHLTSAAVLDMPEDERKSLWVALVDLVTRHRRFSDTDWAMKAADVDKIAIAADLLSPKSPIIRYQRLFGDRDFEWYDEKKGGYEEQQKDMEARRQDALREIISFGGIEAVMQFVSLVQTSWRVGVSLSGMSDKELDSLVLPNYLNRDIETLHKFASGYISGKFFHAGWKWVDETCRNSWTKEQLADFFVILPFTADTWRRVAAFLGEFESEYWSKVEPNAYAQEVDVILAFDNLLKHGRPYAALRCFTRAIHEGSGFDSARAIKGLEGALRSNEFTNSMDSYLLTRIIHAIQGDPKANPDEIAKTEWAYLPLLTRHNNSSPKFLWKRLASEPEFYCDVIRLIFRSNKEEKPVEDLPEEVKSRAANAYRLISEWRYPPGSNEGGDYDGEALRHWLNGVRESATNSGHLDIAMSMAGHTLIYVPADPNGLWIHQSAADVLNAKDAEPMRNGFRTEMFNSRGVHWVDPSAKPERSLAQKYRERAEAADIAGFHRLATTMRELAETYDKEAERIISRERFVD
ncbi:MAG: hypothetical protein K2W84_05080 [Burkholderiales bacterium]|nr:hypothetical protein [Burkholderiales bacterium]